MGVHINHLLGIVPRPTEHRRPLTEPPLTDPSPDPTPSQGSKPLVHRGRRGPEPNPSQWIPGKPLYIRNQGFVRYMALVKIEPLVTCYSGNYIMMPGRVFGGSGSKSGNETMSFRNQPPFALESFPFKTPINLRLPWSHSRSRHLTEDRDRYYYGVNDMFKPHCSTHVGRITIA